MKTFSFTATQLQEGERLDAALAVQYSQFSRAQWASHIKNDQVTINSSTAKPSDKLKANAKVAGTLPVIESTNVLIAPKTQPEILYQDKNVIVINKPAGLVVHPSNKSNQSSVAAAFASETSDDDPLRPGIVHRLDKDTSGVMILARNTKTKAFLQAQFKDRAVEKTYLALVQGHLKSPTARIELPLERSKKNPEKMIVSRAGKPAISQYETVTEYPKFTLVKIQLLTGRTHQIRAHFAHIGHPVVGDKLYGSQAMPQGLKRQFLHASSLTLKIAPKTVQTFNASLPLELMNFLETL